MRVLHKAITVGTSSLELLPPNPLRIGAIIQNDHATNIVYLKLETVAAANQGIRLNAAGGSYEINLTNPWLGYIYGISSAAGSVVLVTEVSR